MNDAEDVIGEPPRDFFSEVNPERAFKPEGNWQFHTKAPLDTQEYDASIKELSKYALERSLKYITLPDSLRKLKFGETPWIAFRARAYRVAEGTDKGWRAVGRDPQNLFGIIVRVNATKFEFILNKFGYIAFSIFESNGKQEENEVAEEMLRILYETTHGKLYAHLDSKDGTKIIGELPEYHHKIDRK